MLTAIAQKSRTNVNQPLQTACIQLERWFKYWVPENGKAPFVSLIIKRKVCGIADAQVYLETVSKSSVSRDAVFQAFYDFTQGDRNYIFMTLKNLGLTAVNAKVITDYIGNHYYNQKAINSTELDDDIVPINYSQAISYSGFTEQSEKIFWTVLKGFKFTSNVNRPFIRNANNSVKAIIGYYCSISDSYSCVESLGIGEMCTNSFTKYVHKYFSNEPKILSELNGCSVRAFDGRYMLNRLELSQSDNIVSVSYVMTRFEDGRSQNEIVGIDKFQINDDKSVRVILLSPKE